MNKLEQAARQALSTDEALVALELILRDGIEHGNWPLNKNCEDGLEAITVLREALAEPDIEEMTLTQIAERHEQAEQKPVAWAYEYGTDRGDAVNEIRWYPNLTALDNPKPVEGGLIRNVRPLYAAPVRTKDLTDDEIEAMVDAWMITDWGYTEFVRAVIAADREKNK